MGKARGRTAAWAWASAIAIIGAVAACSSPAPTTSPTFSNTILAAADEELNATQLPADALPAWAVPSHLDTDLIGYRLTVACGAVLATDRKMPAYDVQSWMDASGLPQIDLTIAAYGQPLAVQAVNEAAHALTCKQYRTRSGEYRRDGMLDLPAAAAGTAQVGFCDLFSNSGPRTPSVCTVILGGGSLACSVRFWAASRESAASLATSLLPVMRKACLRPDTGVGD